MGLTWLDLLISKSSFVVIKVNKKVVKFLINLGLSESTGAAPAYPSADRLYVNKYKIMVVARVIFHQHVQ